MWQRGEHTKLRRWLDELPVELVFSKPHLCIFHAWTLFATGQQNAADRSLQAAEQVLGSSADCATETSPGADRMKLQGRIAVTRAFMAFSEEMCRESFSTPARRLNIYPSRT
jgi:ATP/maltotriose-dependent transcriptional regulator MalT